MLLFQAPIANAEKSFADWTEQADVVRAAGPAVVRVPTAALILSGRTGGSIGVGALATPLPLGERDLRVAVLTEVDGATLPEAAAELDVFVYALGPGDEVVDSTTGRWSVDPERLGAKRGLKVLSSLDLPPGDYRLRILVSHRGTGALGLHAQTLTVPPLDAGARALLAPWLLEPLAPWLVALPADGVSPIRPLVVDSELRLPAARPALEAADTIVACVPARRPGAPPWKLAARFEDRAGLGAEAPLTVLQHRLAPWPDLELLLVSTRVPDLPPGEYDLRVVLEGAGVEPLASPILPVRLGAPAAEPGVASRDAPEPEAPGYTVSRRGRLPRPQVAADYRKALRLLADGEASPARDALSELEVRADRAAPGAVLEELEKIQWQVLDDLAETSRAGLLPVAKLHADLIPVYRQRGASPLVEHAIRMSRGLARSIARHAQSPDERADAARALVPLAELLLRSGRLKECEELFELALQLEESHAAGRLGLAVSHERGGRYAEAAAALERLVELHPDHAEGRLRLTLNLERLGKPARSRPLLESLRADDAPRWIAVLAAQEAARIALREERVEEASRVLAAALGRWPDHPGLRLQRAHALDRLGRSREAREEVADLVAAAAGAVREEAPRHRYNRWPEEATRESQRQLEQRAVRRLDDLARALAAPGETQAARTAGTP